MGEPRRHPQSSLVVLSEFYRCVLQKRRRVGAHVQRNVEDGPAENPDEFALLVRGDLEMETTNGAAGG